MSNQTVVPENVIKELEKLPEEKKQNLLSLYLETFNAGFRALILSETKQEQIAELDTILSQQDDALLFEFGEKNIENFLVKFQDLTQTVSDAFSNQLQLQKP